MRWMEPPGTARTRVSGVLSSLRLSDESYTPVALAGLDSRQHKSSSPARPGAAMSALQAFLVEDNAVIRDNLAAALEEMVPLSVVGQAEDVPAALQWFDDPANRCDLVIIDVFLREGSGIDLLRALSQRSYPADRVVLTNYATPDIRRRCLELGASQVFDKSSDIDALVAYCAQLARPN